MKCVLALIALIALPVSSFANGPSAIQFMQNQSTTYRIVVLENDPRGPDRVMACKEGRLSDGLVTNPNPQFPNMAKLTVSYSDPASASLLLESTISLNVNPNGTASVESYAIYYPPSLKSAAGFPISFAGLTSLTKLDTSSFVAGSIEANGSIIDPLIESGVEGISYRSEIYLNPKTDCAHEPRSSK